ncbi:MAG: helix-turn-helix transcriptional regulator [Desulfomonilaceae bacterium]
MDTSKMLTAAQVGDMLGVSRFTVYEWARKGIIPTLKIGPRKVFFPKGEIDKFLDRNFKLESGK